VRSKGARGLEFWATNRISRDTRDSRFDNRLEVEYGLTDQLMAAGSMNTRSVSAEDPASGAGAKSVSFAGVSAGFKYKLADPMADAVGLALHGEVTYAPGEVALESKLILDKRVRQVVHGDNVVAEAKFSGVGTEVEQLNAERALYVAKCTGCRSAQPPSDFAATERPAHVADMRTDAKLQADDEAAITRYLVTFARR